MVVYKACVKECWMLLNVIAFAIAIGYGRMHILISHHSQLQFIRGSDTKRIATSSFTAPVNDTHSLTTSAIMSRSTTLLRHGQCLLHNATTAATTTTPIRHSFSPRYPFHRQYKKHHFSLQTYLPVLTPTFWKQIIPRFLRRESTPSPTTTAAANTKSQLPQKTRVWNPATWYVVIFFIIGSEAIQLIAERHTREDQVRKSEIRIRLLRELVESVQNGTLDKNLTAQDLKKRLLAGTPTQEREWEEGMFFPSPPFSSSSSFKFPLLHSFHFLPLTTTSNSPTKSIYQHEEYHFSNNFSSSLSNI